MRSSEGRGLPPKTAYFRIKPRLELVAHTAPSQYKSDIGTIKFAKDFNNVAYLLPIAIDSHCADEEHNLLKRNAKLLLDLFLALEHLRVVLEVDRVVSYKHPFPVTAV